MREIELLLGSHSHVLIPDCMDALLIEVEDQDSFDHPLFIG